MSGADFAQRMDRSGQFYCRYFDILCEYQIIGISFEIDAGSFCPETASKSAALTVNRKFCEWFSFIVTFMVNGKFFLRNMQE